MSKNLVSTPTDYKTSTSTAPSGSTKTNGEPGLPQRTGGLIPEVTRDNNAGLERGDKQ
jgi:hypothetical protein